MRPRIDRAPRPPKPIVIINLLTIIVITSRIVLQLQNAVLEMAEADEDLPGVTSASRPLTESCIMNGWRRGESSTQIIDRALDYTVPSFSPRTNKSAEINSTRAVYSRKYGICSSIAVSKSCAASKSSNTQFDDDNTAFSIE